MSSFVLPQVQPTSSLVPEAVLQFLTAFRGRLRDRRFWVIQAMVLFVTAGHFISEIFAFHPIADTDAVYFIPASLYFFPVLYASLNFGKEGAVPTALWSAFLAIPNVILWHHGAERLGEAFQLGTVVILATIVATRVDREIVARKRAEEQELALRLSELKYQSLFDNAGQAIIVFDSTSIIREANAAAASLFGLGQHELKGAALEGALGADAAESVAAPARAERWVGPEFLLSTDKRESWLEPLCARLSGGDDGLTLALFRDVTARRGFQSYAREIVRAQEEERQRIARELHDVSLQGIVLLCRRLDEVEEAAEDMASGELSGALVAARGLAESIGDELRRFSRDLRPSVLDDLGLVPAMRSLVSELSSRSGIQTRFILAGSEARLDSNYEVSLFRICQEGLRNVERHSGASRVTVRLTINPESVKLSIVDNGCGFALPQSMTNLAAAGRLGLLGMQERATLAGGGCDVTSHPGKGTRINVRLPGGCPPGGDKKPANARTNS